MNNQFSLFGDFDPTPAPPPAPVPYTGSTIYETKGKAREYRELAANLYSGCNHGCTYCWAPLILQKDRKQFHSGVTVRPEILKKLQKDARGYQLAQEKRQVLLCFTCDPYFDGDNSTTRAAIQMLHTYGLSICTLTKGGQRALRDIDLFTPLDSFATTLTTLDPGDSRKWEPNAATPSDRAATLKTFHRAGIPTWVSLEPVLDPDTTLEIIRRTAEYVDEFKVGVLNYHPHAKEINWRKFGEQAVRLLKDLGKAYYLKMDLRKEMGIGLKKRNAVMTKYVVFDLETGGLDAAQSAIMSAAAITLDENLKQISEFYSIVKDLPEKQIEQQALDVNGITLEEIEKGMPIINLIPTLQTILSDGAVIVCHNAAFDCAFLNERGFQLEKAIDTMFLSWRLWPRQKAKLGIVCARAGIDVVNVHNSLGDCKMTAELLRYFNVYSDVSCRDDFNPLEPEPIRWKWWER